MMIKIDERANGHSHGKTWTCEEFQERLPDLIGANIHEHEHLQTCELCSELVTDLEIIRDAARNLFLPIHEPGDVVWEKIANSIPQDEAIVEHNRRS